MVKTKTKTPTLDSVRKVKSGVTELVLQNQKLKKKCRKLKKKVAKLETTSKKSFRNDEVEKKRATTKALMDKKRATASFLRRDTGADVFGTTHPLPTSILRSVTAKFRN